MTKNTIHIIAPSGRPGKRVRLAKTIALLAATGRPLEYRGWERVPGEPLAEGMNGISVNKALMKGGGYRSKKARLFYLWWIICVFVFVLTRGPRHIYALGLETALPIWLASRIRRRVNYVFDDADRFLLIFSLPKPAEKFLAYLERKVSRDSLAHIIPSTARYDYETTRMVEVFNMPSETQIGKAEAIAKANKAASKAKLRVYINGWLDPTRGLTLIDGAVEELSKRGRSDIHFKVAVGNLTAEPPAFFSHENVNYLGSLTHLKSMAEYKTSDAVLTFYDPAIRINRFAIPNKWGDAIAMGTPVIVNEGVQTAAPLLDIKAAFATPFDNPIALADLLCELADNPAKVKAARKAILSLRARFVYFDEAMAPVINTLLS